VIRRHVWISGRVQNVWFRDGCAREAEAAGVTGWVRNLPDGRVEAVFEGEAPAVERVVRWCREGPSRARVSGLDTLDESPVGERGFAVR
jgi:acylphosphatase